MRSSDNTDVACQRCHHRKKKCDRTRPSCGPCERAKASCVYNIAVSYDQHPEFVTNLLSENSSHLEHIGSLRDQITSQHERIEWLESRLSAVLSNGTGDPSTSADGGEASVHELQGRPNQTSAFTVSVPPPIATDNPSPAERIVRQIITANSAINLHTNILQQLGTVGAEDTDLGEHESQSPSSTAWPPQQLAERLVKLYFDYTICFYPIHERSEVLQDLKDIYAETAPDVPTPSSFKSPDYRVYRLAMMLAAGCTLHETQRRVPRTDASASLCRYAFEHFPAVFRGDDLQCLIGIMTFGNYCILDFGRTSPDHVARVVVQFAVELGLHKDPDPSLPLEERDRRRRIFYAIYNLDRVVALTLTKPLLIPDEIITTELPTVLHATTPLFGYLDATTYFHQTMRMRKISGIILTQVYLSPPPDVGEDREQVLATIHNMIDDWYSAIPRDSKGECYAWFELFYNILMTNLYRPSSLFHNTHPLRMTALRRTAYRAIQLFKVLQSDRGLAENLVHLSSIVTAAVTLIYTLLEAEGDPRNLALNAWKREALSQVLETEQLLAGFCANWVGVQRFYDAYHTLANEVRTKVGAQPEPDAMHWTASTAASTLSLLPSSMSLTPQVQVGMLPSGGAAASGPSPQLSDQGLWDAWTGPALLSDAELQMALPGLGMDALLASVGLDFGLE
ncbi:hypothetical protein Q8F55_001614 [Vanrija albida]|uniref:Zn(2)-C6 fungal-type domain-containing protein n=1 Tax=Vanrija albida TaxID=181172 RepID=A0ABR3QGH5_9TREE